MTERTASNTDTQADSRIDAALAHLRQTAPPPGLEGRMLQRLNAPPQRRTCLLPWIGALGTAAAVLALASLLQHMHPRAEQQSMALSFHAPLSTRPVVTPGETTPLRLKSVAHAPSTGSSASALHTAWLAAHTTAGRLPADNRDPAFLPSMPAPVQPLTPEERTLVRMARHEQGMVMAQLEIPLRHTAHPREVSQMPALLAGFGPEHSDARHALATNSAADLNSLEPDTTTEPQ